jgi:hypothetical protein
MQNLTEHMKFLQWAVGYAMLLMSSAGLFGFYCLMFLSP